MRIQNLKRCLIVALAICGLLTSVPGQAFGQSPSPSPKPEEEVWELLEQAEKLRSDEQYDAAFALAERSLSIAEKTLDPESLPVGAALEILAFVYHKKNDYVRAEPLYQRTLKIGEKQLGAEDPALLPALNGLANLYYGQDKYDKAEPLYQRELFISERTHGAQHVWVAGTLHRLGVIYKEKGELDKADLSLSRALTIFEKSEEKSQDAELNDIIRTLSALTEVCIKKQAFERAELLTQKTEASIVKVFGLEHDYLRFALTDFANLYEEQGQRGKAEAVYERALRVGAKSGELKYLEAAYHVRFSADRHLKRNEIGKAESLYQRSLRYAEKAFGEEHLEVASFHDKLGNLYERAENFDKAESFYKRTLAIYEKDSGSGQNIAYALGRLGNLYDKKSEYGKAESLFKRAVTVAEKTLGADHKIVAIHLGSLAFLYFEKQEYDRAEPLFLRGLEILEKTQGTDHPDLVLAINPLASLYSAKSDYVRAELLYSRALAIREKALGTKHPDVASSLDRLAWIYDWQGEYGKAEASFQRALAIREEALGAEHPAVASSLGIIASRYEKRGDYQRAEPLYVRALAIREKALGTEHPDVADSLDDLAWLYFMRKDYSKAELLSNRALKINEKTLGADHVNNAYILNQIALIYKGRGDFEKAEPLYQRALKIVEKAYGAEHTSVTQSLHNLALLYVAKREYGKAESLLQRSLAIEEKAYGSTHPDLAENLTSLAYLYAAKGDIPKAVAALTRGTEISERTIARTLATAAGTEEQKRALMQMQVISNETHGAVSAHINFAPDDPQAMRLALNTTLRRKGRVLDAVSESMQTLRRRAKPEDMALLEQLNATRSQLAAKVFTGSNETNKEQRLAEIAKLEKTEQRLEAEVSSRSAGFWVDSQPMTFEAIQKLIPDDSALVEIVAYKPFNLRYETDSNMWGAWCYAAYVLRREGKPSYVDLGDAVVIDKSVAELRSKLIDGASDEAAVKAAARGLDKAVMQPIRKLLGTTRHVLLSPDGALNLVPFAALVDEQNRYLVETYSFSYLTSGRDLLRLSAQEKSERASVIIANPSFNLAVTGDLPANDTANTGASARRSADFNEARFSSLPGTAAEAYALKNLLPDAQMFTERAATEAALKRISKPRILHIATHGFFLPDRSPSTDERRLAVAVTRETTRSENPLLRSGLVLAGAMRRQSGAGEDGILTALEVAGLDLWGTKLVVLSACETGLGEVNNGDGVYGLRRALVLAGSETQVMTLWRVSDAATRDLMIAYYTRLKADEGRMEALRQVQLEMLKSVRHNHPYFWASVIQSGDWRRLSRQAENANK